MKRYRVYLANGDYLGRYTFEKAQLNALFPNGYHLIGDVLQVY